MEVWKDVVGYEGLYAVSSLGRVKSLERTDIWANGHRFFHREKILKPMPYRGGYLEVHLRKPGEKKQHRKIHRLVAESFLPNPNNLPLVNHKDESKTNNCVDNIEWCDAKYNRTYGTFIPRHAIKKGCPVRQYDKQGNYILTYRSMALAEQMNGKGGTSFISHAIKKKWFAYGSHWEHAPKDLFYGTVAATLHEDNPPSPNINQ